MAMVGRSQEGFQERHQTAIVSEHEIHSLRLLTAIRVAVLGG